MMKRLSFYVMRSLIASTASFHHQMIITTESTKLAEPCKPWGLAMSYIEQTPFTFNEFTENPEPRCACLLRRSYAEPLALLLVCLKLTMPVGVGSTMLRSRAAHSSSASLFSSK